LATGNFVTRKAESYADDMRGLLSSFKIAGFCAITAVWYASASLSATLYYWVDANGTKHWSDRPAPGSTAVESVSAQRYSPPAHQGVHRPDRPEGGAVATAIYSSLDVVKPEPDSVLTATAGTIECAAQLSPTLAPGHSVWFELDGARYDSHGAMAISLPAPRGTHVVRVLILSSDGNVQIESAPVTFHVRQASIAEPPVGPTLKKPR
jgi:hypothetical protein